MPRLLVDISAHGFGHLSQTAPVLNAICMELPDLQLTVRSGLPIERLMLQIGLPFCHIQTSSDFGYVMHNAIDLDLVTTGQRYRDCHRDWKSRVAAEGDWQRSQRFDAVLSNVAYLPLAGAAAAGIPALAMCSLNWADLFHDNFASEPWAESIWQEMLTAYASAQTFLRLTPGLSMQRLGNVRVIGPVGRISESRRSAITTQLEVSADETWLLVAMGGIDFPLDLARWPRQQGLRYLVPAAIAVDRPDVTPLEDVDFNFSELLASADVVLTKPGYGTFVEAACHGRPVIYVTRENWAEQAVLTEWLHENTRASVIGRDQLISGDFLENIATLRKQIVPPRPTLTGIPLAAAAVVAALGSDEGVISGNR